MTRDVDWMKEELRKGQKLPVIVRGRAAPYQVIAGFTRAEAAAALAADGGTERVMVHRYAELDDARAWEIAYTENDKRKSITDLDRLHLAHRMRTEGRTVAEVAALLGRGERIVTYYLSLARTLEEIPTLRTALRERRISTTHAYVLCEHQETLGTEAVADLVARVAAENLSVRALKALVRPAPARQTYRETPDGFTLPRVVFSPEKASPAEARQLLQDLERAVEKLRRHIQSDE
jgi:predicted transcriptional regulator